MEDSLRRKLWNRANWPIWSLATKNLDGSTNMNICSYVTPISMEPKGFVVGLYHGTKTLENIERHRHGVLQLLADEQKHLVRKLGMKSAMKGDKMSAVKDEMHEWADHQVLSDALGITELSFTALYEGGDHIIGYAEVVQSRNLNVGAPLTLHALKEYKIIR